MGRSSAKRSDGGAAQADPALHSGLSTLGGKLVSRPVAEAHDLAYTDPDELLATR